MKESSETQSLCQGFNGISVKPGDTFKIDLFEGGRAGISYTVDVVVGDAALIETSTEPSGDLTRHTYIFRADEAGKIEVAAQANVRGDTGFSANRYMLRVQ